MSKWDFLFKSIGKTEEDFPSIIRLLNKTISDEAAMGTANPVLNPRSDYPSELTDVFFRKAGDKVSLVQEYTPRVKGYGGRLLPDDRFNTVDNYSYWITPEKIDKYNQPYWSTKRGQRMFPSVYFDDGSTI